MVADSTKADDIAIVLEDEIVSGAIAAGSVLRQELLSERFDVSRTPIREALRRLAALGLVSFEPNKGVRVRTLSRAELREAFLVRAELEGLATERAAPRMTPELLAALDSAEHRFAELTARLRENARRGIDDTHLASEWMRANHAFHDVIDEAADAPYVANVARAARRTFAGQVSWVARTELDDLYARNDAQHRAIRAALAAGSPEGARALAHEHVLSSSRLLEAILDIVEAQRPTG
jgi:DNA-binding GntR family transcriptional regulator